MAREVGYNGLANLNQQMPSLLVGAGSLARGTQVIVDAVTTMVPHALNAAPTAIAGHIRVQNVIVWVGNRHIVTVCCGSIAGKDDFDTHGNRDLEEHVHGGVPTHIFVLSLTRLA